MTSLRDVADRAGVSVATASRVMSGSAAVRPETRERVERAMRELLYVAARAHGADRARSGCWCPSSATRVRGAGTGDGDARHAGGLCDDPLQHGRLRHAGGRLRAHAPRAPRGRDGLHLRGDDRRPRRALALPAAARPRRTARVRQRRLGRPARDRGRRRRAAAGRIGSGAPARAGPPADRVPRGRGIRPADAREAPGAGGRAARGGSRSGRGRRARRALPSREAVAPCASWSTARRCRRRR